MKRLARRDPLIPLCFLVVAVVLASLPRARQLAISSSLRSTILQPVLGLHSGLAELRSSRTSIQALRAQRDSLAARLLSLTGVVEENQRLRDLIELAARGTLTFKPANLYPVGRAGEGVKRSFVLDLGANQGVARDAVVVAPRGLIGVVRVVASRQSVGDFWTHPDFRVSAMTADGRVFGIVRSLGRPAARMLLEGVPYQVQLAAGTELLTSGQGGVFPRGIPIGRVSEQLGEEAGWARSYAVQPTAYPDEAREVMVMVGRGEVGDLWSDTVADFSR